MVSTFSTWGAFLIVVASLLISRYFVKPVSIPSLVLEIKPQQTVQQSTSYSSPEGASTQLSELQVASGVKSTPGLL
jgi:hypothetical protein